MREAWEPKWQSVRPLGAPPSDAASLKLPVTAAAAQLGLGVFASGPLGEGSLIKDRQLLVRASRKCPGMLHNGRRPVHSQFTGRIQSFATQHALLPVDQALTE